MGRFDRCFRGQNEDQNYVREKEKLKRRMSDKNKEIEDSIVYKNLSEVEGAIKKSEHRKDRIQVYVNYFGHLNKEIPPIIESLESLENPKAKDFSDQYEEIKGKIELALKKALKGKDSLFHRYARFSLAYHDERVAGEGELKVSIKSLSDLHETLVNECQEPGVEKIIKAHFESGYQHWQNRQYKEALYEFNQVLELNGEHVRARELRGKAHLALRADVDALKDLKQVIESGLASATAFFSCGVAYQRCKKNREALECYNQAIKRDDKNAAAFAHRGQIYLESGDLSEASSDFKRAIELRPKNAIALMSLGEIHYRGHQYKEALEYINQFIQFFGDNDTFVLAYRGKAHQALGNNEKAADSYQKALSLGIADSELRDSVKKGLDEVRQRG
jgi:tetratricopeptide (TPR) repeat protein